MISHEKLAKIKNRRSSVTKKQFLCALTIADLRVGDFNNRYLKRKHRWARGLKTVMTKIATFAFGFFAFLLANLVRCAPAQFRKSLAGALGNLRTKGLSWHTSTSGNKQKPYLQE